MQRRKGMQQVTNINTPRTIRSRLSFPRRKAPATDAAIAEAPAQQVARSNSGKAAMGPWMGSFGGMQEMGGLGEDPPSPTLFASSQGRVFADLAGAPVVAEDLVPNPEAAPAHMAMAHREQPPLAIVEAQAGMMRRKADASWGMPARRAPCANNLMRRQRRIGQARKQNS